MPNQQPKPPGDGYPVKEGIGRKEAYRWVRVELNPEDLEGEQQEAQQIEQPDKVVFLDDFARDVAKEIMKHVIIHETIKLCKPIFIQVYEFGKQIIIWVFM